ncbi:MAG: PepSY domain-containing protein [Marinilabiliales bacterium]|nr:PepSY domain-containing protein [Marinilabiliales bacterium]
MISVKIASRVKKLRKYHKWPGIIVSLFVLLFATSGVLLNHRSLIAKVDISRRFMPPGYEYRNWNLSGLRSALPIDKDTLLLYGNVGIWKVTQDLTRISDFNRGFQEGIDNRKIYALANFKGTLVAATHFGLYRYDHPTAKWKEAGTDGLRDRLCDLTIKGDSLMILSRDALFYTTDLRTMHPLKLPPPIGYERKAGLFITLWQLHSGELFGWIGRLIVDLLGFVLIFLTLTGLFHFLFPKWIQRRKSRGKSAVEQVRLKRVNLKWHNLVGYVFALFLVINTTAGVFLRPPLLIPIASAQVGILPFSNLDVDNPWHDKLRRIRWDESSKSFLIHTSDGFYKADAGLADSLSGYSAEPPVSIMGCNVLEKWQDRGYLVGSFSGMFIWNPETGSVEDLFTGKAAVRPQGIGRPVSDEMCTGYLETGDGAQYWIDYNRGILNLTGGKLFPGMTQEVVEQSPISLWNAALEVHTGRIFEHLVGPLYLLYVPLIGISLIIVLISGFLIWWHAYHRKKQA